MYTFQALQVLIFLIPGLISSVLLNALISRKEKNDLSKIVEALIFSMLTYFIYSLFIKESPISLSHLEKTFYSYDRNGLFLLIIISLLLSVIASWLIITDTHMKIARFFKLTNKTARKDVWLDAFYDNKKHIIVNFKSGQRIIGWPEYFSDDAKNQYIFLSKPSWIDNNKYVDLKNTKGLLITPNLAIEFIEFLDK